MAQVNLDNGHLKDFLESTRRRVRKKEQQNWKAMPRFVKSMITLRVRVKQLLLHLRTMSITTLLHLWKKTGFCGVWMDAKPLQSIVVLLQKKHFYRTLLSSARRTWIVIPIISTLL